MFSLISIIISKFSIEIFVDMNNSRMVHKFSRIQEKWKRSKNKKKRKKKNNNTLKVTIKNLWLKCCTKRYAFGHLRKKKHLRVLYSWIKCRFPANFNNIHRWMDELKMFVWCCRMRIEMIAKRFFWPLSMIALYSRVYQPTRWTQFL